ncbi:hypothetical protein HY212_02315 [Candidatus Pacearchaeota archaeon]|nr:hypothetical protein [Candidatus Pacearchaeota archaeon]
MVKVDIGRTVDYETLEKALFEAAKKVGLKARVEDQFDRGYKLGSVQETQRYSNTMVYLRGRFFPAMAIYISGKGLADSFSVWNNVPLNGLASESTVRAYLSAVSEALSP